MKVLRIDQIDLNHIAYCETYSSNAQDCHYIRHKNRDLFLMTSPMRVDNIVKKKDYLELCLEIGNDMENFFNRLDNKIIEDFKHNPKYKMFKVSTKRVLLNNDVYSRGIKLRLINNEMFKTKVYDLDEKTVSLDYITPNIYIRAGIEIICVWLSNKGVFGIYIKPHQIKIESNKLNGYVSLDYTLDNIIKDINSNNKQIKSSNHETETDDSNNSDVDDTYTGSYASETVSDSSKSIVTSDSDY